MQLGFLVIGGNANRVLCTHLGGRVDHSDLNAAYAQCVQERLLLRRQFGKAIKRELAGQLQPRQDGEQLVGQ